MKYEHKHKHDPIYLRNKNIVDGETRILDPTIRHWVL